MPPCIEKWLDDVIVGACVEAADAILFERSGSEKDDWGSFVVTSQLLADVEAVFAGKRHVEDDEVKRLLACAFGGLRSVADKFHVVTFDAERVLESERDPFLIFDYEYSRHLPFTCGLNVQDVT